MVESEDVEEEEGPSTAGEEDLHALLVKAWEAKVFPVIQRRFRNDQERKSGLEQIKGALQLGACTCMTVQIACTVRSCILMCTVSENGSVIVLCYALKSSIANDKQSTCVHVL